VRRLRGCLATVSWHVTPVAGRPAAIVVAVVFAVVIGYPTLGLRDTTSPSPPLRLRLSPTPSCARSPGSAALNGFPTPIADGFANLQFADKAYVLTALALFAIVQLATILLGRSRMGYYLRALRANHEAASALGISERR